jgi:hypothetical protein
MLGTEQHFGIHDKNAYSRFNHRKPKQRTMEQINCLVFFKSMKIIKEELGSYATLKDTRLDAKFSVGAWMETRPEKGC